METFLDHWFNACLHDFMPISNILIWSENLICWCTEHHSNLYWCCVLPLQRSLLGGYGWHFCEYTLNSNNTIRAVYVEDQKKMFILSKWKFDVSKICSTFTIERYEMKYVLLLCSSTVLWIIICHENNSNTAIINIWNRFKAYQTAITVNREKESKIIFYVDKLYPSSIMNLHHFARSHQLK